MSLAVKNTSNLEQPYLSFLVYGESKSGKTTFASTFPQPLFLSFEPGMFMLRHKAIDYVEPETWHEILSVIAELQRGADKGTVVFQGKKYCSVVIDPLNEMFRVVMSGVLQLSGREIPTLQDWGLASDRLERIMREIVRLPVHTCFTCLEQVDKDEHTGRILTSPLLPAKLSRKAPAITDFFFHAQTEQRKDGGVNYILLTCTESIYPAGGRLARGRLASHEVPDFQIIYSKINKEVQNAKN